MEKDPFISFISDLSKKIKISREHKQIMERVNDPKNAADTGKASLENLLNTIKEKIESAATTKQEEPVTITPPITSSIVKVVSEEENNFEDFVGKLKNILAKPREEQKIPETTTPTISAEPTNQEQEEKKLDTKKYVEVLKPKPKKEQKTKAYVNELEKIKDGINVEKEDSKVTEIKKLIEEYAEKYIKKAVGIMGETGGGTVAKQFANGGTMDGDLNVNGNFLSGGVNLLDIFALQPDLDNQTLSYNESNYDLTISNGNSVNLSSINTTFNANSAKYETTFTYVSSNSARLLIDLPYYIGVETENNEIRGTYYRAPYLFTGGSPPPGSLPYYYTKITDYDISVQPSRKIVWVGLSGRWEIMNTISPSPGYTVFAFCSGTPDQVPTYFWSTQTDPLTDIRVTIQDKSYYDIANVVMPAIFDVTDVAYDTATTVNTYSGFWESAIQAVNGTSNQIVATNTGTNNHNNQTTLSFAQSAVFPGDVLIPGTLTVTGTATYINTKNLIVDDPIIFLANNNAANIVDTGFISHFKLGPPLNNTHTGLVRRANQGVPGYWTLFSGLTTETLTAVNIDWDDPNITLDTLSANIATNNGTSEDWNSVYTTVKSLSDSWEESVFITPLQTASASWNSVYTTTNNNSASWSEAYTNLVSFSAVYLSGYVDNRYFYKDSNFTANPNTKYSTGTTFNSITAILPLNSIIGDSVEFFDADGMWDINPLIIDNNNYAIESIVDSLSCDVRYGIFKLINTSPNSLGWRIVPLPRHSDVSNTYKFIGLTQALPPSVLIASSCGSSDVSLSAFINFGSNTYIANDPSGSYSIYLYYGFSAPNIWEVFRLNFPFYTFTFLYSAAGTFGTVPLVGWTSRSPSYDPPPTFSTTSSQISSLFDNYNAYFPRLDNNDTFFLNDKTVIGFLSSIDIPVITALEFKNPTPISSIDLSYFKSLSALSLISAADSNYITYTLSSINLTRNPNLLNLNIRNNTSLKELDIRNNKKLTYIDSSGNSNLSSFKLPESLSNVTLLDLSNTRLQSLTASKISGNPNLYSVLNLNTMPQLSTLVLKDINFISSPGNSRIIFSGSSNLSSVIFTSCSADELYGNNLPRITNIDLTNCAFSGVYLSSNTLLSGLFLPLRLRSIDLNNCSSLSSSFLINNVLSTINTYNYTFGSINYLGTNSSRTSISNSDWTSLLGRGYTITPLEIDASPFPSRPAGYVASQNSDSITVMSPISTRNDLPALYNTQYDFFSTRFNVVTGEYLKTLEIYNNRDVWKNSNNYFILFNNTLSGWTLVGPLSTSSNILLSASESYNEWGTPPAVGWFGKAFQSGGFTGGTSRNPATFGSVWGQSTSVASTRNTLFSSFFWGGPNGYDFANQGYLGQGQARIFGLPSAGYNSSFYWKDYDFTGLLYNVNATPMNTGRGILISPIHFLCQNHYLPWGGSGTTGQGQTLVLYNADGTTTTRTVLSSQQYPFGSDTRVGILNAPVTNTFYPVASGSSFISNVLTSINKLSCFLVGPFQSSKCGLMPLRISGNNITWLQSPPNINNFNSSFYRDSYSIPRSLMFGESIAGGDSSTQMWFLSAESKRPIVLGGIQFGSGTGPGFGVANTTTFLKNTMDALSNQFSLPIYSPILVDK